MRRIPALLHATDLEVLVGGDDWALEGFCAGATGWVTGVGDVAPARVRRALRACRAGDLDARARGLPRGCCRSARFDMTPKLVQYFKAAQDAVGFAGGPTRAPRLPLDDDERAALREALAVLRSRGPRVRAARYLAAVDSHTEGMPTRVITGGVGPIPGATMLERKLRFEAERDDLRLLLMREPRGHAAMSGAILQPPTRDGRRLGRAVHRGLRLPADVRARDDRRRHRARRDRHGRGDASPRPSCGSTRPAGPGRGARARSQDGRARPVTIRNVPSFLHARDRSRSSTALGEVPYDMAFGGNFYALVDGRRRRAGGRPGARAAS